MNLRLVELGDAALTLKFGDRIDPVINAQVMATRAALPGLPGVTDVVPGYCTLTVHFDPLCISHDAVADALHAAATQAAVLALQTMQTNGGPHREIPVLFDGPDLAAVASVTGRSTGEIISTLCALELRVFLIGFLPGFPYLGELPEWLRLPRRATPRTAVSANSVAIAGAQAAIYPWESPGGWHLLGRTPLTLFDATNDARPALLAPGDRVRFVAVEHA